MPTEVISVGPPITLVQNQVYAMPGRVVRVHALAVLEISPDGLTFDTLTASDTVGTEVASGFIRSTSASNVITLKAR